VITIESDQCGMSVCIQVNYYEKCIHAGVYSSGDETKSIGLHNQQD
jgi:hypothetical protein